MRRALVFLPVLLAGCTAGPDFEPPPPPETAQYGQAPLPEATTSSDAEHGEAQRFLAGRDIPVEWWTLFKNRDLEELVRRAIETSPTLGAAVAALQVANESYTAVAGAVLYPHLDAALSARRQKISGATFGGSAFTFSLFSASLALSYDVDVAGGNSRTVEAARAQVDYQRFQLEAAYLSLTSNVVAAAVRDAALRAQIQATQEVLQNEEEQLDLVDRRFELGALTRSDVLTQRTRVSQTRALLPPLEKALAINRHLLATLVGQLPGEAALPEFDLAELHLPEELPVSLPSDLARQRPDIRAAEALLHSACAQVGVATANLYPQLTLTGSMGSESSALHELFDSGTFVWGLGANALQPVFNGGELRAERRAAIAAYDEAGARYQDTLLHAFQEVADVLHAIGSDADELQAQAQAAADAQASLDLAQEQLQLGAVSYLTMLLAQRQVHQTRLLLVQAQANRFLDTVALFQALGGGWWNREPAQDAAAAEPDRPPEAPPGT